MRTSDRGIALIKEFEGRELKAYEDIAGVWTIGYGHTGPEVGPGKFITPERAEQTLRDDLKPREAVVNLHIGVPLNQNEFDALVSFEFNTGGLRRSTALRRLNKGDRIGAAEALQWWNKARVNGKLKEVAGLTRRRAAEAALFLEPVKDVPMEAAASRLIPEKETPIKRFRFGC